MLTRSVTGGSRGRTRKKNETTAGNKLTFFLALRNPKQSRITARKHIVYNKYVENSKSNFIMHAL